LRKGPRSQERKKERTPHRPALIRVSDQANLEVVNPSSLEKKTKKIKQCKQKNKYSGRWCARARSSVEANKKKKSLKDSRPSKHERC